MSKKAGDLGEVSWRLSNDFHEGRRDLLRKLRFITKAGSLSGDESTALELIDDYLGQKEIEFEESRQPGPDGETPEDEEGVGSGIKQKTGLSPQTLANLSRSGPETVLQEKNKSLRPFDSLYDQYADFCRKLRFLIMGAFKTGGESLALEIISEFLEHKEKDLNQLKAGAKDRIDGGAESVELLLGRLLMEREDYKILQRVAEIRHNGGPRWNTLQGLIMEQAQETSDHPRRPPGFKDGRS